MADADIQAALQSLQQLGAIANNSRASVQAVGQSMARLRMEMQRGTGTIQSNAAALQQLMSDFGNLDTATRQSTAGMNMLKDAQVMAAKVTADAAGQMSAGLLKAGLVEAVNFVTNQLYTSIAAYQAGASGIDTLFAQQNASIESQIRLFDKLAAGTEAVATTMALIPNPIARGIAAISGLASGAFKLGRGLAELDAKQLQMLQKEITNTGLSFSMMEKNGAAITGGFIGMRDAAGDAQLYQEEFSKVVVRNKQDLMEFGNTVTGGVKKFRTVNLALTELSKGGRDLRKELALAGYSAEEQADGLIQYMDMLNKSGQLQKMSDKEIAVGHAEYLKNLRAVSMFTGEDAKQAQARSKQASEQLAVQAKLAKQGPGAFERFTSAVSSMGPEIQKGLQQMTAFDGTIVDKNLNQLLAASPTRKKLLEETYADMQNSALTSEQVNANYQKRVAEYGEALKKEALDAGETYGAVTLATGQLGEVTGMMEKQAELGRKGIAAKEAENGQIETTVQQLKQLTTTVDPLRTSIMDLDRAVRDNLKPQMGSLSQAMNLYLLSMNDGRGALAAYKEQQKMDAKALDNVLKLVQGKFAAEPGGAINKVMDTVASGLAESVKSLKAAAKDLGGVVSRLGEAVAKKLGFAKGGIVSGPSTGYTKLVEFHGTEAIFPKQALDFLSGLSIPDPKQMLDGAAGRTGSTAPAEMNQIVDTVTASMTGITNQLTAQNQKTEGKFDELLQAMRDKSVFEDMLEQFKETAENTRRMANELS